MKHARIDVRELGAAGAAGAIGFGVPLDAQMPVRGGAHATGLSRDDAPASAPRSWWRLAARIVRNAAVAVAVMALVPIGLVAVNGNHLARTLHRTNSNVASRVAIAEVVRSFRLPSDPSITPMQAGLALNALQPTRKSALGFEAIEPTTVIAFPWQVNAMSADLFVTARTHLYTGPSSLAILEATSKGLSPDERAYLRALATAPLWRDFDVVARAPAVDVLGGQFRVPFGANALPEQRPQPSFRGSREIAFAAVSRAAHHMASGQRDSAEVVLRSIVSFGFALIDNGTSTLEELIGVMIVSTGRDALQRFYTLHGDPRAGMSALAAPAKVLLGGPTRREVPTSAAEVRRLLLARIQDPSVPPGGRFDGLRMSSTTSCTNVRELLLGPASDLIAARDRAGRLAGRYPSERALLELESRMPTELLLNDRTANPFQSLAVSTATVAGVVLRNPRLVTCTRLHTARW